MYSKLTKMFAGTEARNRISISPKIDSHDFLELSALHIYKKFSVTL